MLNSSNRFGDAVWSRNGLVRAFTPSSLNLGLTNEEVGHCLASCLRLCGTHQRHRHHVGNCSLISDNTSDNISDKIA